MPVGDVNSSERGSGARYNDGKPPLDLIPLRLIALSLSPLEGPQLDAGRCLLALGQFQERRAPALDAIRELGDCWEECAAVFDYGRRKYAAWNWSKGMPWSVPIGCAARHLLAIIRGEWLDPESGLPHRGHVLCNLVMLALYERHFVEGDDRPEYAISE